MPLTQYLKISLLISTLLLTGCIHPISRQTRDQTPSGTTLAMMSETPSAFLNQSLIVGGVIISTERNGDETVLELMEWQLNALGEPTALDEEARRFLVKSRRPLDPAIYESGVLVTLAGVLHGRETRRLDEQEHAYPVFNLVEIHPWESPFRYGIHRFPGPGYPHYVGKNSNLNRNPYDPGYSVYPYTRYWYRN